MLRKVFLLLLSCLITSILLVSTKVSAADPIQKRFGGSDRYATSISICKNNWDKSDYAVLVSGEDFADALCAAPLAKKFDAPIILTSGNVLESSVKTELLRLNVKKVFIIGADGVISDDIERKIYAANIDCQRIYGNNRYETSLKVAQFIGCNNGIVVASGENFPDALSIAPIAATKGMPILLTDKHGMIDEMRQYIEDSKIKNCYIVGAEGVVSDEITKIISNSKRISGVDRYETNLKVINEFSNDIDFSSIYVTTGEDFPDAVAGTAAAARIHSPIIFTDGNVLLLKTSLASKIPLIHEVRILGGEEVMTDEAAQTLLSEKKIVKDKYGFDAEKVSEILENNAERDGKKIVFLTFDDGPSTTVTPRVLDILKNNNVKATFFLIGCNIEANKDSTNLVKRIIQEGHAIGNHTYTHNYKIIYPGNKVDTEKYMEEVKKTNDAISNIIGHEFKTRITRMPGGYMSRKYYNDPNLSYFNEVIKANNMYSIDWNAYDGDAEGVHKNAEQLLEEVKSTVGNKDKVVLLMHDTYGKEETAKALPSIIEYLKNQGYEFKIIK